MTEVVQQQTTSALAVKAGQDRWTPAQEAALASIGVRDAPTGDQLMFLAYAQRTGLDPFSRQLYMIGRNDKQAPGGKKWTIQASIDGLRIVAERSGKYRGQVGPQWCGDDGQWVDVWLSKQKPRAARVGVLRADFDQPLYAVAMWDEYVQTNYQGQVTRMWAEKGALMLAKCAEALALRKAFPNDLSGIYTADEMSKADEQHHARPAEPRVDTATGEVLDEDADTWRALVDAEDAIPGLQDLWRKANADGRQDICQLITAKAQALQAQAAAAPVEQEQPADPGDQITDAELVDEPEPDAGEQLPIEVAE